MYIPCGEVYMPFKPEEKRLIVVSEPYRKYKNKEFRLYVKCNCTCGTKDIEVRKDIVNKRVRSCGCLQTEANEFKKTQLFKETVQRIDREKVLELYNQNLEQKEIAKLMNTTTTTIYKILKREFKIQTKYPTRKKEKSHNWKGCREIPGRYFTRVKSGAIDRNIPFEITIEDFATQFEKQNGKCALTGVNLSFGATTKDSDTSTASLDRIDSSKGYTKDNIQWIHKDLQKMKWDLTQDNFIEWCKKVYLHSIGEKK